MDRLKSAVALGHGLDHLSPAMVHAAVALGLSENVALDDGEVQTRLALMALKIEAHSYQFRAAYGVFPTQAPQYLLQLEAISVIKYQPNRKQEDWMTVFTEFALTGMSLQAFCRDRDINYEAAKKARQRMRQKSKAT